MRHGLRLDRLDNEWTDDDSIKFDPPLSAKAYEDLILIVKKNFSDFENIDYVLTSPFLRCVQTASYMAEYINVEVKIEKGLHEVLKDYDKNKQGLIKPEDLKTIYYKINDQYKSVYNDIKSSETKDQRVDRLKKVIESIDKKSNVLLVTHAIPARNLIYILSNKKVNLKMAEYRVIKDY